MVCSCKKVHSGGERYWTYSEYYEKGKFLGEGSLELGLYNQSIEHKDKRLDALFLGKHPSGTILRNVSLQERKYKTVVNGKPLTKVSKPVLAWDLTFSAPKSVSAFLVSDCQTKDKLKTCHENAVNKALEGVGIYTRSGRGGYERQLAKPIFAMFPHETSRSLDPDLHTHVVVINSALSSDGKWRSVDGQVFDKKLVHKAGADYRRELKHQLELELHVNTVDVPIKNGQSFHIEGVPLKLCDHWSKRRIDIVNESISLSNPTSKDIQNVVNRTRAPKKHINSEILQKVWEQDALQFGFDWKKAVNKEQQPINSLSAPKHDALKSKGDNSYKQKEFINQVKPASKTQKLNLVDKLKDLKNLLLTKLKTLHDWWLKKKDYHQKKAVAEQKRKAFERRVTFLYATYKIDDRTYKRLMSPPPESRFVVHAKYATYQISKNQRDYFLSVLNRKQQNSSKVSQINKTRGRSR
jgi:conjugative relaxase-like TrwC/TraI family protein